jgi:hypothetical protein
VGSWDAVDCVRCFSSVFVSFACRPRATFTPFASPFSRPCACAGPSTSFFVGPAVSLPSFVDDAPVTAAWPLAFSASTPLPAPNTALPPTSLDASPGTAPAPPSMFNSPSTKSAFGALWSASSALLFFGAPSGRMIDGSFCSNPSFCAASFLPSGGVPTPRFFKRPTVAASRFPVAGRLFLRCAATSTCRS